MSFSLLTFVTWLAPIQSRCHAMGTPPQQTQMNVSFSRWLIMSSTQLMFLDVATTHLLQQVTVYLPLPGIAAANISTISGLCTTGHFADEICTLQSAMNALSFTYPVSGMCMY